MLKVMQVDMLAVFAQPEEGCRDGSFILMENLHHRLIA